jgi:signal transduction histidine kinase
MLDRLEEAFQREKQFTADASHELRTPISVILAQCEYSLELAETKEDYQEALQVIEEQGFKMKELVSQLLFFARMEQGHESLHLSKVNISQLTAKICEEQIALHSVEENNANIQLATDIEPDIISSVDQALFIRLLTNLISNAYQYGKSDGHITVTLACQPANQSSFPVTDSSNLPTYDSAVCLTVSDDGIGIASEHLPYIWNRFYQADPARTASAASNSQGGEAAGAGLGLSMVKAIAAVHGGSAAVDSAPGQGSIFTVTLPLR